MHPNPINPKINSKTLSIALLSLLVIPTLTGSMLLVLMARLAKADTAPVAAPVAESEFCYAPAMPSSDRPESMSLAPTSDRSLIASAAGTIEHPMMDFTAAEC